MNDDSKKPTIVFAPGAFDQFDGTQEELDEFIADITKSVESGTFIKESKPVDLDKLEDCDPELYETLVTSLKELQDDSNRNRKLN